MDRHFLLRAEGPLTGMLSFFSYDSGEATTVQLVGYLYGDDPASYVAEEQQAWCDWLATVIAHTTADAATT